MKFRIVRTADLDALQARADALDQRTDEVQVHILRRALALELLGEIVHDQRLPYEVTAQIQAACAALTRGGEEGTS